MMLLLLLLELNLLTRIHSNLTVEFDGLNQ